jgi:HEAT repeat protein
MAIGLHDDVGVSGILKDLITKSNIERVRSAAIFWLGQIGGEQPFLAGLVRSEQESTDIRKKAAFAIGASKDETSLPVLRDLYKEMSNREVKKQIIFAISINNDEDGSLAFLIDAAKDDTDREARKQAIFWLGQKAGKRALEALGDTLNSNDADTEIQKQAVFAISQRNRDEAVPLLIKIARTHAKGEVRKQAIFWLGQTGDERALEFFKEILLK